MTVLATLRCLSPLAITFSMSAMLSTSTSVRPCRSSQKMLVYVKCQRMGRRSVYPIYTLAPNTTMHVTQKVCSCTHGIIHAQSTYVTYSYYAAQNSNVYYTHVCSCPHSTPHVCMCTQAHCRLYSRVCTHHGLASVCAVCGACSLLVRSTGQQWSRCRSLPWKPATCVDVRSIKGVVGPIVMLALTTCTYVIMFTSNIQEVYILEGSRGELGSPR